MVWYDHLSKILLSYIADWKKIMLRNLEKCKLLWITVHRVYHPDSFLTSDGSKKSNITYSDKLAAKRSRFAWICLYYFLLPPDIKELNFSEPGILFFYDHNRIYTSSFVDLIYREWESAWKMFGECLINVYDACFSRQVWLTAFWYS